MMVSVAVEMEAKNEKTKAPLNRTILLLHLLLLYCYYYYLEYHYGIINTQQASGKYIKLAVNMKQYTVSTDIKIFHLTNQTETAFNIVLTPFTLSHSGFSF